MATSSSEPTNVTPHPRRLEKAPASVHPLPQAGEGRANLITITLYGSNRSVGSFHVIDC
jgi:hypothetical protein